MEVKAQMETTAESPAAGLGSEVGSSARLPAPSSASSPAGPGGLPGRAGPGWVELGSAGCTRLIPETLRGLSAGAKPFLAESEHRTCTHRSVQLPDLRIPGWPLK